MAEYRRRLPHFQPEGEYLFVTWRLHGTLPIAEPDVIYANSGHAFAAQDRALNQCRGARWLSDTRVAGHVADTIRDGERQQEFYETQAWVIMPNHVHLLTSKGGASQNHALDQRENGQGGKSIAGPGGCTILAA